MSPKSLPRASANLPQLELIPPLFWNMLMATPFWKSGGSFGRGPPDGTAEPVAASLASTTGGFGLIGHDDAQGRSARPGFLLVVQNANRRIQSQADLTCLGPANLRTQVVWRVSKQLNLSVLVVQAWLAHASVVYTVTALLATATESWPAVAPITCTNGYRDMLMDL
jgi:hypothetical protein